ncbi:MAG: alpha-amlyase [Micrococcales bacterium 73-15]|uniref:alpha-amylase n=1 Tax=Salana multivorans TaxID=120377 RepID=UPI0009642405|nr:alpha-amylase family protein [Salana multivorans]OJX94654.1 MAG: alpha-amlyase [Micrococcales bacterium 73-15]
MPRRRLVALLTLALTAVGLGACAPSSPSGSTDGAPGADGRDVGVQLFQWTWDSIARECTDVLGPAGFGWVLTSPPQEHVLGEAWWTAYQPVSYLVESRLGTREEFAAMVTACREAGVDVIADAVVNHMTGQDAPGTGWAGSPYEHYSYPGLYTEDDFHHCGLAPNDDIADYSDAAQVQTCELVNLADLDTADPEVQASIRGYLEDLLDLGVAGFRIDAAKHIAAEDVAAILEPLPEGTIVMQEVIGSRGEPIQPADYADIGSVFDFYYAGFLTGAVTGGTLEQVVHPDGANTGLTSEGAVVFVDNHDTERNGTTLSFRDGERYQLAMALLLASPYGTPVILSGYEFGHLDRDLGPNQDAEGAVLDAECASEVGPDVERENGDWICQHRWDAVLGMVEWRRAADGAPVEDATTTDRVLTLHRGDAVLAANGSRDEASVRLATGLPAGDYCDLGAGPVVDGECVGGVVAVDEDGVAELVLPSLAVVALAPDARPAA